MQSTVDSLIVVEDYSGTIEECSTSRTSFSISGSKSGYTPFGFCIRHDWTSYYVFEMDTWTASSGSIKATLYYAPIVSSPKVYDLKYDVYVFWLKNV